MAQPKNRLPFIENERIINETLRRARRMGAAGQLGSGGTSGVGANTLEALTDVDIAAPADGDMLIRDGAFWIALGIPADWATRRYVLGIAAGLPAWVPVADGALATGWGFNWGNNYGGR